MQEASLGRAALSEGADVCMGWEGEEEGEQFMLALPLSSI